MARARNIKPSFFQDDKIGELEPLARLTFIGMWTLADFKGCIEYRPKMLKVQILPYDECNIEQICLTLEQFRFIRFYSVQGKRYIKVVNFERHQNPHKNEREAGSDIPDISESDLENNALTDDGTKPEKIGTTRADSLLLIPSTLIPDSLSPATSVAVAEEEKTESSVEYTEQFESFWKLYPNRKNKGAAFKAFKKLKPSEYPAIRAGVERAIRSPDWVKDNGRFIPHPASWLNARGWEDEPEIPAGKKPFDMQEFLRSKGAMEA